MKPFSVASEDRTGHVLSAVVEHVRHVLDDHGKRCERLYVAQVLDVEKRPRIVDEGLGVLVDLPELRPPDTREGLARGTADDHVEGIDRLPETKLANELSRLGEGDVPSRRMPCVAAVEVSGPIMTRRARRRQASPVQGSSRASSRSVSGLATGSPKNSR